MKYIEAIEEMRKGKVCTFDDYLANYIIVDGEMQYINKDGTGVVGRPFAFGKLEGNWRIVKESKKY